MPNRLSRCLIVALMFWGLFAVISPKAVFATDCGDVLVGGASWAGGNGVDVHFNGTNQGTGESCAGSTSVYNLTASPPRWGMGWQCVELAARLYKTKGWSNGLPGIDYAAQIYTKASGLGMTAMAQGAITIADIVPGDMVISDQATYGHVSVVSSVDLADEVVHTVEQNASNTGWADYTYNANTKKLTRGTYYRVTGVVHDPDNTLTNGPAAPTNHPAEVLWLDNQGYLQVLKLNAAGNGFDRPWSQAPYAAPTWASRMNVNGGTDHRDEVVMYHESTHTITVMGVMAGTNYFTQYWQQSGWGPPTWAAVADLNGDGKDELLWFEATSGTIKVLGKPDNCNCFNLLWQQAGYAPPVWAGVGDVNANHRDDVVWLGSDGVLHVFAVVGSSGFTLLSSQAGYGVPTWAGLMDFDGNGHDSLLWLDGATHTLTAMGVLSGTNGFTQFWRQGGYGTPTFAFAADIDDAQPTGASPDELLWYEAATSTLKVLRLNHTTRAGMQLDVVQYGYGPPVWAGAGSVLG